MTTVYTDVQELSVGSGAQTSFTITAVDNPEDSILFYQGVGFFYNDEYSISSTTLTWSGVDTQVGEKLYLLSNPSDVSDVIYTNREKLVVQVDGQTEFYLMETPEFPTDVLLSYNLIAFPAYVADVTISGNKITWSGVTLKQGETIEVYY